MPTAAPAAASAASASAASAASPTTYRIRQLFHRVLLAFSCLSGYTHAIRFLTPIFLMGEMGSSAATVGVATAFFAVGKLLLSSHAGSFVRGYGYKAAFWLGAFLLIISVLVAGATGWLAPPDGLRFGPASGGMNATAAEIADDDGAGAAAAANNATAYTEWTVRVTTFAEIVFTLCMAGAGAGYAFYFVSQLTWMTAHVVPSQRGLAFAFVGGTHRFAGILYPLIVAALSEVMALRAVFLVIAVLPLVAATLSAFLLPREDRRHVSAPSGGAQVLARPRSQSYTQGVCQTAYQFRFDLLQVGVFVFLLMTIRSGREILIPLIGLHLELSVVDISTAVSASYICGTAMFPLSGLIMDRLGRKVAAGVSLLGLSGGFVVLAFAASGPVLVAGGALCGLGNGLSSGLVQTFGGDLAPQGPLRGPFLGVYKLTADAGSLLGPLLAGVMTDAFSVYTSAWVFVFMGGVSLAWLVVLVKETRPKRPSERAMELADEDEEDARGGRKNSDSQDSRSGGAGGADGDRFVSVKHLDF